MKSSVSLYRHCIGSGFVFQDIPCQIVFIDDFKAGIVHFTLIKILQSATVVQPCDPVGSDLKISRSEILQGSDLTVVIDIKHSIV